MAEAPPAFLPYWLLIASGIDNAGLFRIFSARKTAKSNEKI